MTRQVGGGVDLQTAMTETRELIREARATIKDLRQAIREAKETLRAAAAEYIDQEVKERVEEAAKRELEVLGRQTRAAMDRSVAKVAREFDKLANLYMTGDEKGRGEPLAELAERHRQARENGGGA